MSRDIASALGTVLIIGGGNMGRAICAGLLQIDGVVPESVIVANPGEEKRRALERDFGVRTVPSCTQGLPARTIIIAVKPKLVADIAGELAQYGIDGSLVISIAAGVSTQAIANVIGNRVPIVRVMPNTPLQVGHGVSAISAGEAASQQDCELVHGIFASMGRAVIIEENMQDVACSISGSGPAYFELFVETIARQGEQLGLDYETSLELALQTMYGTAALIDETQQDLPSAIKAVSSPGGTTVAALDAMRAGGIEDAIRSGVTAAARRSEELGI